MWLSISAESRLWAVVMAWKSPVKWRFISSIGTTWARPPPAAPPFMPKFGPSEASRMQMMAFLPMRFRPSPRPTVVVVLPSPAGVGLMAVTRTGVVCRLGIGDVADQAVLAATLFRRADAIDAHIDHRRSWLHPLTPDHFRAADSSDQDVRATTKLREVLGPAVSDGDGGVRGEQKVGHRLANDVGATDDDCIEAGKILAVNALDQQHRAGRCAGHEGRVDLAGAELADI